MEKSHTPLVIYTTSWSLVFLTNDQDIGGTGRRRSTIVFNQNHSLFRFWVMDKLFVSLWVTSYWVSFTWSTSLPAQVFVVPFASLLASLFVTLCKSSLLVIVPWSVPSESRPPSLCFSSSIWWATFLSILLLSRSTLLNLHVGSEVSPFLLEAIYIFYLLLSLPCVLYITYHHITDFISYVHSFLEPRPDGICMGLPSKLVSLGISRSWNPTLFTGHQCMKNADLNWVIAGVSALRSFCFAIPTFMQSWGMCSKAIFNEYRYCLTAWVRGLFPSKYHCTVQFNI